MDYRLLQLCRLNNPLPPHQHAIRMRAKVPPKSEGALFIKEIQITQTKLYSHPLSYIAYRFLNICFSSSSSSSRSVALPGLTESLEMAVRISILILKSAAAKESSN